MYNVRLNILLESVDVELTTPPHNHPINRTNFFTAWELVVNY